MYVCMFDIHSTANGFKWERPYSIKAIGFGERINLVLICIILCICVKTCLHKFVFK